MENELITVGKVILLRTVGSTGKAKYMAKARLRLVNPTILERTVTPSASDEFYCEQEAAQWRVAAAIMPEQEY